MPRSFHKSCKAVDMLTAASYSAGANNGTAIDTLGFEEMEILVSCGVQNTTGDLKVQESDASGSGFADISGAAFTQFTTSNDVTVYHGHLSLRFTKRYIRVVYTTAGTAGIAGVIGLLSCPRVEPTTPVNTIPFALVND